MRHDYIRKRAYIATICGLLLVAPVIAGAQTVMPSAYQVVLDSSGRPVSGALIYVYAAGTTTAADSYTDNTLATPNANPIVADSAGRYVAFLPSGQSFKFVFKTAAGATLKTVDGVQSIPSASGNLDVLGTAGEALVAGDVVYLSDGSGSLTAGKWYKADADETYSSTLPTVGIATAPVATDATGTVRLAGRVTGLSSLVVGSTYYISATAGAMTTSAPANARLLGAADSTTSLVLQINTAAPSVPISSLTGAWTTGSTDGANFTANGTMSWTVEVADVESFAYIVIGKTMFVEWVLSNTVVGGAANTQLQITIPASKRANRPTRTTFRYYDGTNWKTGHARVATNGTQILLMCETTGNWPTTATAMEGQIVFEIQ